MDLVGGHDVMEWFWALQKGFVIDFMAAVYNYEYAYFQSHSANEYELSL
jgi:hypothetical protein